MTGASGLTDKELFPRFTDKEYARRYRAIREAMQRENLDAILISGARGLVRSARRSWQKSAVSRCRLIVGMCVSRLLKTTHMLRCAQSPRSNVLGMYASARRFFARLASEIVLSSLPSKFSAYYQRTGQ